VGPSAESTATDRRAVIVGAAWPASSFVRPPPVVAAFRDLSVHVTRGAVRRKYPRKRSTSTAVDLDDRMV
jgi:hypothetical protein